MSSPKNQTPTPLVSSSPSHKLDPIAVLREELAAAAMYHGVERVEDLTEALVSRVVQRLGGTSVYVRNARVLQRERLAQEVRAKFNGRNTRALAREYGVSVRWVQRLLASPTRATPSSACEKACCHKMTV
ncbi:MAG: Mor transcription activator family protein [Comamonas sp.]|uniref:Mor transcription activator family protein n=1 Tax=Comamonas sp. TaxID=34028 RepID=UPI002FC7326C